MARGTWHAASGACPLPTTHRVPCDVHPGPAGAGRAAPCSSWCAHQRTAAFPHHYPHGLPMRGYLQLRLPHVYPVPRSCPAPLPPLTRPCCSARRVQLGPSHQAWCNSDICQAPRKHTLPRSFLCTPSIRRPAFRCGPVQLPLLPRPYRATSSPLRLSFDASSVPTVPRFEVAHPVASPYPPCYLVSGQVQLCEVDASLPGAQHAGQAWRGC